MRRREALGAIARALATLAALVGGTASAQEDENHEALRALRKVYEDAVNQDDVGSLRAHFDSDFTAVPITNDSVRGFEGFEAYWTRQRDARHGGGHYQVNLEAEQSLVFGDVALAYGTTDDQVTGEDGRARAFKTLWTVVCRKSGGRWRILRLHASIDPFDNPFVQAAVREASRRLLLFSVVAFALGAGAGAGAVRLTRKGAGSGSAKITPNGS